MQRLTLGRNTRPESIESLSSYLRFERLLEERCIVENDDPTVPDGDGPEGSPVRPKNPKVANIPATSPQSGYAVAGVVVTDGEAGGAEVLFDRQVVTRVAIASSVLLSYPISRLSISGWSPPKVTPPAPNVLPAVFTLVVVSAVPGFSSRPYSGNSAPR